MPRIEALIAMFQERSFELAKMQQRLREVRDRHEPPAEQRLG
jgi:hypothetical protein